jgi:hypothetical protein
MNTVKILLTLEVITNFMSRCQTDTSFCKVQGEIPFIWPYTIVIYSNPSQVTDM